MLLDAQMVLSLNQAITVTAVSTNVYDAAVQRDLGNGDDPTLDILTIVTAALTGGTSILATLQGSVDNATFYTLTESAVVPVAALTVGARLLDQTVPRYLSGGPTAILPQPIPRYYRMNYTVVGTFGAGTVSSFFVIDRQGFIVYPPGLVIAN